MKVIEIPVSGWGCTQLIVDEKTALIDCAYSFSDAEILNGIKENIGDRKLDYIFLTHSHFDHVGSLSAIRKVYPEVRVVASEKTAKVFKSPNALAFMEHMTDSAKQTVLDAASRAAEHPSQVARTFFSPEAKISSSRFDPSGLFVDIIAHDGYKIDLGENIFTVLETRGHTDCCISFYCKEASCVFASESIGVWRGAYPVNMEICKGYRDVLDSIRKIRDLKVKKLYLSHSGLFTDGLPSEYLTMAEHGIIYYKDLVYTALAEKKTDEEIWQICRENIFDVMIENGMDCPDHDRWLVNTKAFVSYARKDFSQQK